MSHNYPYRVPPPQTNTRSDRGASGPSDSHHSSGNAYMQHQDSYAPSYSSSTSFSSATSSAVPQDNVLSLLSSCGLEPEDLARLAELPEDALTVESLPHILQQMKGKKGVVKPYPSTSFHSSSTSQPAADWEQLRSQPVQYPLISSTHLPSEKSQEHWGTPRTSSSIRTDPPSSSFSSSGYVVHTDNRARPPKYGKTDPVPSFSAVGRRPGSSHFSDSGPAAHQAPSHYPPPPLPPHPTNKYGRQHHNTEPSSSRSSQPSSPIPSMKQALDFHGTPPSVFPYACSLCDITVLSEKVWIQHINSTQHADGQLKLLQEFPKWDCRVETVNRDDSQSQNQKKKRNSAPSARTANQNRAATQSSNASQKKIPDKGKVVCVKFPPQSVDEAYLRKLIEPFGKIVKILMFPSLAFVELGSDDQAKDLVKFHVNYPPTVNGLQIEFSISSTFNFLQSAQVVSFTPAPAGADGRSDLICIIKRFGTPLYTLFLPSKAYVEMTTLGEAQKLVDYYSSNVLRISDESIKVCFSGEYKSLARISSAKKYEEPPAPKPTKRTRSRSRDSSRSRRSRSRSRSRDRSTRTRSRSRSREKDKRNRTRSRSRDKFNRDIRTRSRSADKSNTGKRTRSRSRSRERPEKYKRNRTRSRSRDKRTRSRSKSRSQDKTSGSPGTQTRSGSKATSVEPEQPAPVEQPKPAGIVLKEEEEDEEDDDGLSVDDSDIEGMQVIGGEVEDEDAEEEEEEEEEEEAHNQAVKIQSPEHGREEEKDEEREEEEPDAQEKTEAEEEKVEPQEASESPLEEEKEEEEEEEEEEAFPVDLENCITLDELGEDDCAESGEEAAEDRESPPTSSRVLYISDLPSRFYSDADFLNIMQGFGTAVRYLLIRSRREGFVEMSSPSEAAKAARELNSKPAFLNKSKLKVLVSHKYHRLTNGWTVEPEDKSESRSSRRTRRRETSKKTPDRDSRREPSGRRSPEKEIRDTVEEESASRETTDLKETSEETQQRTEGSQEEAQRRTEGPEEETQRRTEGPEEETQQRTKGLEEETQRRTEGSQEETQRRTESPEEMKTPEKEVPPVGGGPESQKEKEESESQTDLRSTEKPPEAEKDNSKETEEKLLDENSLKDEELKSTQQEEDSAAAQKPSKPVGTEFVRPVVGYFCNLCQVIYADEDEAKQEHCSTLEHYRRYQEKTGRDPWTS